jgi:spore germination protein KC
MNRRWQRWLLFLLLALLPLNSGCWNYRELDQLAIVAATGIDRDEEREMVKLTVQIIKPGQVKTGGGEEGAVGGEARQPVLIMESTGVTIFEAVRNFVLKNSRRLYWSHNQVLIIGKKAAEDGVRPLLDFFLRDHEPRPTVWVLVADRDAVEIIRTQGALEKISGVEMGQLIEAQTAASKNMAVNLEQFTAGLMSKTTSATAPIITITHAQRESRIQLDGSAVFQGDRMIGKLTLKETRGVLWATGKVKSGTITVRAPGSDQKVGLEIIRATGNINSKFIAGQPKMKVKIEVEGNLGCQMSEEDLAKPEMLHSMSRRMAEAIRKEVYAAIDVAKQLQSDVFGFGETVYRTDPRRWKPLEPIWKGILAKLPVEVDVRANIHRMGLITKPAVPEEN